MLTFSDSKSVVRAPFHCFHLHHDSNLESYDAFHSDAAYRFYKFCCEQKSVQRRGKGPMLQAQRRKHERLNRVSFLMLLMLFHACHSSDLKGDVCIPSYAEAPG